MYQLKEWTFISSGGLYDTFYVYIIILFVLLYDTLMKVAEERETCRCIVMCDKIKYI